MFFDNLLDSAEDIFTRLVKHLDPDFIAELHEWCLELTGIDLFKHALFCETGRPACSIFVTDGAASDDGASCQRSGLGRMLDKVQKPKCISGPALGSPKSVSVVRKEWEVHSTVLPRITEFIQGHCEWTK